jgi:hypothetical protein
MNLFHNKFKTRIIEMILDVDRNVGIAAVTLLTEFLEHKLLTDYEIEAISKYIWCDLSEIRNTIIEFIDMGVFNNSIINNNDSSKFNGLLFMLLEYIEKNIKNEYNKVK